MNPVAIALVLAGLLVAAVAGPLIRRQVPRNVWYGMRLKAAFASDAAWYAINEYGGRLFRGWGFGLVAIGALGVLLPPAWWIVYSWGALFLALAGLAVTARMTFVFAARHHASPEGNGG